MSAGIGRPAGARNAASVAAAPAAAVRLKASSGEVASPSAPIAGPASEPNASTLITWPTVAPRDSFGAFAVSHAMPHVHAMPEAAPWIARAPPSTSALGANANARVEAANRRPARIIMRRPP